MLWSFQRKAVASTKILLHLKSSPANRVTGKIEGYPHLAYQLDAQQWTMTSAIRPQPADAKLRSFAASLAGLVCPLCIGNLNHGQSQI